MNKNLIRRMRFYPSCLFFLLDNWLKEMSLKGYHLVDYRGFVYYFEKGIPLNKEYFTYTSTVIGEGKYSIPLRYPFLNQTYGVHKKRSKLNKNSLKRKGYTVIEIDTKKTNGEKITGYKELISDRNRLYLLFAIRNISVVIFVIVVAILFNVLFR